ncbi:hypothetical protein Taro_009322 [Colocasia esculenta]|uniref:Uncharacterized protein n=1 Tax=Colocasia esculenta TaxID=4460 RepID=A0A843U5E5_COLES|nr:hypothetical protein [Colocasia esculenta]
MERHKPILQPFFPCCIRTPKTHRCLNTLHPNPRDEFITCWGRVEELLVAGELWIIHKKLIFFPRSSATTCTNRPLEVDQSGLNTGFLDKWDFFNPEGETEDEPYTQEDGNNLE